VGQAGYRVLELHTCTWKSTSVEPDPRGMQMYDVSSTPRLQSLMLYCLYAEFDSSAATAASASASCARLPSAGPKLMLYASMYFVCMQLQPSVTA
jgi:hypothetical protein